jgi:hypothetical protein
MNDLITILINFLKNEKFFDMRTIIIILIIVLILFITFFRSFYKLFKKSVDQLINSFDKNTCEIQEMKNEFSLYNQSKYMHKFVIDNFEIYKHIVEIFTGEIEDIYDDMQDEIRYVEKAFLKNYINGSIKEKALEVVSMSNEKLLELISNKSETIDIDIKNMLLYLCDFIINALIKIIEELNRMNDPFTKSSLIKKYFNNIKNLIMYIKIKQSDLKLKDKDFIKNDIINYFYNMDIDTKIVIKKDFEREDILEILRGYSIKKS